jgi:cell division protein FtsB
MKTVPEIIDDNDIRRGNLFSSTKNILIILFVVVYLGFYIGQLLFGTHSLEVMLNLQGNKEQLLEEVDRLKEENAKLQKRYFELKEMEPDDEWE